MIEEKRRVILTGKWWENGSEPLLALEKETDKPVMLIPTFSGKYKGIYRNNLPNREFGKEAAQILESGASDIVRGQGASEDPKFVAKPTPPKTDSSGYFGINSVRAKELRDYAYCFYPLLPEGEGSPKAIFRLALQGKGKVFGLVAFLTLLATLIALLPLFALQWIFNHIFDQGDISTMWQISWGLCLAAFSSAFFLYLRNRVLLRLDGLFANRIQPALWHRLFQFQIAVFRKISKSDIFLKVTSFEAIRQQLEGYSAQILLSALFSAIYLGAMLFFSVPYTLLVLPFILLDIWGFIYFIRHHNKLKNHIQGVEGKRTAFLSQSLSGIRNVRAAGLETHIFRLWKKYLLQEVEMEERIEKAKTKIELISLYLPMLLFAVILGAAILNWHMPLLGNLFAFYLALLNLCIAIRELTQIAFNLSTLLTRLKKSEKILEEPVERGTGDPGKLRGEIAYNNITIHSGERVGFLAPTNIVSMLLGFESPSSGEIFIDQKKLSTLDLQKLRSQIGVVFHTDGLFAGNVFENIDLGRGCSFSAIEKALELSGFQQDLDTFPMGLNTVLPAHGDTLSGGQKQKLLLTRALAANPSLLLLDHAIDCLDQPTLDKIMTDLKTLPITQIYVGENEDLLKKYSDRIIL